MCVVFLAMPALSSPSFTAARCHFFSRDLDGVLDGRDFPTAWSAHRGARVRWTSTRCLAFIGEVHRDAEKILDQETARRSQKRKTAFAPAHLQRSAGATGGCRSHNASRQWNLVRGKERQHWPRKSTCLEMSALVPSRHLLRVCPVIALGPVHPRLLGHPVSSTLESA